MLTFPLAIFSFFNYFQTDKQGVIFIILIFSFLITQEFEYHSCSYVKIQLLGFSPALLLHPHQISSLFPLKTNYLESSTISQHTCLWESFLISPATTNPRIRTLAQLNLPGKGQKECSSCDFSESLSFLPPSLPASLSIIFVQFYFSSASQAYKC